MKNLSRYIMAGACFVLAAGVTVMVVQMVYWSISGGSVIRSAVAFVWALMAFVAIAYISKRGWRALRGQEVLTSLQLDPTMKEPISEGQQPPVPTRGKGA